MGIYFGTDGFRGTYGSDITPSIIYKIGNSLARLCTHHKKVLIGRDTRMSGSVLTLAAASGLASGGACIVDIGIAPTPVVAYLTKLLDFDYGIVISASHNPKNHNGMKIFDHNGFKINLQDETMIESQMLHSKCVGYAHLGKYTYNPKLKTLYTQNLINQFKDLSGLKIAIDCANGASYAMAKNIFKKCGSNITPLNCSSNGKKINVKCGALYPDIISNATTALGCDMGFSFDGDADRIIACDENGKILDGDDILYLLAENYHVDKVVGTSMTNSGLEKVLNAKNIALLRAEVGDKYVSLLMREKGVQIGGEPCGHIINHHYSSTGDGILTALSIAQLVKRANAPLSSLCDYKKLPQVTQSVYVKDKSFVLSSTEFQEQLYHFQQKIGSNGRLLVRASGTENKIRVMCEHVNQTQATNITNELIQIIKSINLT